MDEKSLLGNRVGCLGCIDGCLRMAGIEFGTQGQHNEPRTRLEVGMTFLQINSSSLGHGGAFDIKLAEKRRQRSCCMRTIVQLYLLLALGTLVSACAKDNYTVINGEGGSKEHLNEDLKSCKREAIHKYFEGRAQDGVVVGSAIGGAFGGALVGALNSNNNNDMKTSDIDPYIEKCMREKGYEGTSEN